MQESDGEVEDEADTMGVRLFLHNGCYQIRKDQERTDSLTRLLFCYQSRRTRRGDSSTNDGRSNNVHGKSKVAVKVGKKLNEEFEIVAIRLQRR
jgi:hypothetical protein